MWKFDFCELLLFSTDSFGDWVGRCSSFIFLGCVLKISLTPQCSHLQTPLLGPDGQYGLAFKHGEQWHPASCDGSSQEFVGFKRGKLAFSCSLWSSPQATLHSSVRNVMMSTFRRVVSKVQSGEGVKVLGDFFAFTCATKLMVKTFYRPSVQPQSADISLGAGLLSNHRFQLFLGFVPLRCAIRFYYTEVILTELCCSSTSSHGNIWLGCLLQVRRFKHVRRGGGPVTPPSCLGFPQKRPSKRTDLIVNSFIAPTLRRICSAAASLPTVMQYKQCFYD